MKATLEIRFESHNPRRMALATRPWPFEQLPTINHQIYGAGLWGTAIEGVEVVGISWMLDQNAVIIFGEICGGFALTGKAFEQACGALEMFEWELQAHVPLLRQNEAGQWIEVTDEDEEGASA